MNKLAPDQTVRDLAIDPEQSFIVQAPAGAGKTSLLTQRILKLLSLVDNPEEIVAITFTRKAAAEMRHRLLQALVASNQAEPEAEHDKVTWRLAKAVMERDAELDWGLLENAHRLRLTTIDSLSSLIASQMPLISELGGSLSISDYPQKNYRQAAQAVLNYLDDSEYGDALLHLLSHLDNQVEKLVLLLSKMLGKRDQWLRLLGAGDLDIAILQQGLDQIADLRVKKLDTFIGKIEASCLLSGIHFAAGFIDKDHPLAALKNIKQLPVLDFEHLKEWRAIADFCLTGSGSFRKSLNKNQGLLADKDLEDEDKAVGKAIKTQLKELFSDWSEDSEFAEALLGILKLPKATYSTSQQQILQDLLKLLRLATIELSVNFQLEAKADFTEVALAADRALGYFDEPSELALKLDYQISHILVDEFQDTSFTQYQLLCKLIAGWQQGDGRSLFLVGDPMQSIYRFREANVGLFIQTQQQGIAGFLVTPLALTANFRSSNAVIKWVNARFKTIFPKQDDALLGAVSYAKAEPMKPENNNHFVKLLVGFDQESADEASLIANEIKQIRKDNPAESIAILVRGRSHAVAIVETLKAESIPYYAKDMEYLRHKMVIGDLLTLARLLLQPHDKIAWLALLKSPMFGLELKDLSVLADAYKYQYHHLLADYQNCSELSVKAQTILATKVPVLVELMSLSGREPLSQLVEKLWYRLAGPSCLVEPSELNQAEAFFEVLLELEQQELLVGYEAIELALAELYAVHENSTNCVEIMTMHKSKGLEFDTVFLPSLQRRKRGDDHQLLLWEEFSSEQGQNYLLAPIEAMETKDPIYQLARDIQKQKSDLEDARLLYVAATRAKQRLVLSCELKLKFEQDKNEWGYAPISKLSLLSHLKDTYQAQIDEEFNRLEKQEAAGLTATSFDTNWYRLKDNWQMPNISNAFVVKQKESEEVKELDFDWASDVSRIVGIFIHRQLELIGRGEISFLQLSENDFARIKEQLSSYFIKNDEQKQAFNKVKKALLNMQQDRQASWILSEHKDAQCEWALTGKVLNERQQQEYRSYIIDRSFVDEEGVRWIIDYKTGDHQGQDLEHFIESEKARYKPQLDQYQQLVEKIDSRPVKKALYFPMFKQLVEVA